MRYRAILKELAATIFTTAEVGKLMTALEAVAHEYLRADTPRARYEGYREGAHR